MTRVYDVIILGGGLAGVSAACRLQARGYRTAVLEVHDKLGGCAGYYQRDGFSFDIGATTLVDFAAGGVGEQFLSSIGLHNLPLESLPGYQAWLPDRTVILHKCPQKWRESRSAAFGDTQETRKFWRLLDELASIFWFGAAEGLSLPIRNSRDLVRSLRLLPSIHWPKARYLFSSLGDHFDHCGLRSHDPLRGLMSMLCEDTLHSRTIDDAPLINAALGTSIRGRISRPVGGFSGFWKRLEKHFLSLGGDVFLGTKVIGVEGRAGSLKVSTKRGVYQARAIVNTIPAPLFLDMAPSVARRKMKPFLDRDSESYGAGIVVCLGVPEAEVSEHQHRHHQLLHSYEMPLGDGNNMFISVSAPGDLESAPSGYRSVMISTHTAIDRWKNYATSEYQTAKREISDRLLQLARKVYPNLGSQARVLETGTPSAYQRFARRPLGAVGGVRTTMRNSNQFAMPGKLGGGIHVAGDYTWPGLGSVACLISSSIAARNIEDELGAT